MKRRRLNITISLKHWNILEKHLQEFETQQKVLEYALESLENNPGQSTSVSQEEELWLRIGREIKSICLIQKDGLKELLETADIERLMECANQLKPLEYQIEYYLQKLLKECNLKEVIDGTVIIARTSNWFDTINYTDNGGYYTLKMIHSLGLNNSKLSKTMVESVFKTSGFKTESEISERSFFIKIYKNLH